MYNKHLTTAKWDCKLNLRRGKNQLVPLFNKGREEIEGKKKTLTPHHTTHGSAFARYPITHLQSIAFQKINRFLVFSKPSRVRGAVYILILLTPHAHTSGRLPNEHELSTQKAPTQK